jgi:hypothetical protein
MAALWQALADYRMAPLSSSHDREAQMTIDARRDTKEEANGPPMNADERR